MLDYKRLKAAADLGKLVAQVHAGALVDVELDPSLWCYPDRDRFVSTLDVELNAPQDSPYFAVCYSAFENEFVLLHKDALFAKGRSNGFKE